MATLDFIHDHTLFSGRVTQSKWETAFIKDNQSLCSKSEENKFYSRLFSELFCHDSS